MYRSLPIGGNESAVAVTSGGDDTDSPSYVLRAIRSDEPSLGAKSEAAHKLYNGMDGEPGAMRAFAVLLALLSPAACGDESEPVTCEFYAGALCDWIATCESDFDDGDVMRCRTDKIADCHNGLFIDYEGCVDAVEHANCQGYPTYPTACQATASW